MFVNVNVVLMLFRSMMFCQCFVNVQCKMSSQVSDWSSVCLFKSSQVKFGLFKSSVCLFKSSVVNVYVYAKCSQCLCLC